MFTYIKAKNFKSLKNIEFNLKRTKNITNDFIAIYGENGSGKTNLVELFKFLQQMTIARTFDVSIVLAIIGNFMGSIIMWYISKDTNLEKEKMKS